MRFHNIETNNIENGTGLRTLLWVSGCWHKCPECHNPMTHDPNDGVEFDDTSLNELMNYLAEDHISGITLTGGDPMTFYRVEIADLIRKIRERFGNTKTIWVYTGYTLDELLSMIYKEIKPGYNTYSTYKFILENIDVLCDGKFRMELFDKDYHWVGSTNQRVIDVYETINKRRVVLLEKDQGKKFTGSLDLDVTGEVTLGYLHHYKKRTS